MIRINASLYYIAKLSKTMKWLKIKMPLRCQNCPVIDGRLTVECPYYKCTRIVDSGNSGTYQNCPRIFYLPAKWLPLVTYFIVIYRVVPEEMNISGKVLNLRRHSASNRKILRTSQNCSNSSGRKCVPELYSRTYSNCTILVRSRIATCDKQLWYIPELRNSGTYQN